MSKYFRTSICFKKKSFSKKYLFCLIFIMSVVLNIFSVISLNMKTNYINKLKSQISDCKNITNKLVNDVSILSKNLNNSYDEIKTLKLKIKNINKTYEKEFFNNKLKVYIRLADYISYFNNKNNLMISYYILYYSDKYDIPVNILTSLIYTESRFIPNAISNKGCIGLTQINYNIWYNKLKENNIIKSKEDLFKIKNNIEAGAYILRYYYEITGNWKQALYNYYGISPYGEIYKHKVYKKAKEINMILN